MKRACAGGRALLRLGQLLLALLCLALLRLALLLLSLLRTARGGESGLPQNTQRCEVSALAERRGGRVACVQT